MNTNYGKLVDGEIVYAPPTLDTEDGKKMNPSEASYLAAGWKKVVEEPPAPENGCTVEPTAWTETDTTLTRVYKQIPMAAAPGAEGGGQGGTGGGRDGDMTSAPAPVGKRVFSKLKLVTALKAAGLWVLTKTWIEENGLYDHYLAAQDLAEDNEMFIRGRDEISLLSHKTGAEVEEILAASVID